MAVPQSDWDRLSASATYGALLVELLVGRGVLLAELLAGTEIDVNTLKSLDGRISARQFSNLILNARRLSGDAALGFQFGVQLKLSSHGFLGFAAMSASTLGEALELAVKYCRTRFDFIDLNLIYKRDKTILQVDEVLSMGEASAFLIESIMASFGVMSLNLLGEIPSGVRIKRVCNKPVYFETADSWFPQKATIEFNQSVDQLIFDKQLLSRPLNLSDPMAKQLAEAQCERELQTIQVDDDLIYRIQRLLKEAEPRYLKLEDVAEKLHMSSRTFKRRLQDRETSFQDILDNVRMSQAKRMLAETGHSIDAIASALGYSDASNFSRAFKRKEGLTPAMYRRHQLKTT